MFIFDILCILAVLGAAWALSLGWVGTAISVLIIVLVAVCLVGFMRHRSHINPF